MELKLDILSPTDWEELRKIADALEVFSEYTIHIQGHAKQGHHGALWEWLPTIEALMTELESHIQKAKDDEVPKPITIARQNVYEKLRKYYNLSDGAHTLYAAATLLSPERRGRYFDKHWTVPVLAAFLPKMRRAVKQLWDHNYAPDADENDEEEERPAKKRTLVTRYLQEDEVVISNVFDSYVHGQPAKLGDSSSKSLLNWWADDGPKQLRKMAYDFLAIPATSCEVERTFSSAKMTTTPKRARLGEDAIKEIELLRNWELIGVFHR